MITDSIQRHTRLQKLSGSNFELDPGQPDIRGWRVNTPMGAAGFVEELIFDEQSGKVRYLVVDLQSNALGITARQVLVPIGVAVIDKDDDEVVLPGVNLAQLTALQEYEAERFDTSTEESIRNVFGGLGAAAINGGEDVAANEEHTLTPGIDGAILDTSATGGIMSDDTNGGQTRAALGGNPNEFYNHPIYNDQQFYRHRSYGRTAADSNSVSLNNGELKIENPPEYHIGIRLRERGNQL